MVEKKRDRESESKSRAGGLTNDVWKMEDD